MTTTTTTTKTSFERRKQKRRRRAQDLHRHQSQNFDDYERHVLRNHLLSSEHNLSSTQYTKSINLHFVHFLLEIRSHE
jgi:uncharacterized protein YjiK